MPTIWTSRRPLTLPRSIRPVATGAADGDREDVFRAIMHGLSISRSALGIEASTAFHEVEDLSTHSFSRADLCRLP